MADPRNGGPPEWRAVPDLFDASADDIPIRPRPVSNCFSTYFPRFWICNARGGLCSKIDEIFEIIKANNVDIVVIVETWLHCGIDDDLVYIPGYTLQYIGKIVLMARGRTGGGYLFTLRISYHVNYSHNSIPLMLKFYGSYTDALVCLVRSPTF